MIGREPITYPTCPCVGCGKLIFGRCCITCIIKRGKLNRLKIVSMRVTGLTCQQIGTILNRSTSAIRMQLYHATQENFQTYVYGIRSNMIPREDSKYDKGTRT